MKNQPKKWKKIFSNHKSNKGLIYRLYKEFIKQKKPNLNRHFPRENIPIAYKHMKRCQTSLVSEMQVKPQWDTTSCPSGCLLLKI